jgi:hypothetical protein
VGEGQDLEKDLEKIVPGCKDDKFRRANGPNTTTALIVPQHFEINSKGQTRLRGGSNSLIPCLLPRSELVTAYRHTSYNISSRVDRKRSDYVDSASTSQSHYERLTGSRTCSNQMWTNRF